jgi:hypothetical protein
MLMPQTNRLFFFHMDCRIIRNNTGNTGMYQSLSRFGIIHGPGDNRKSGSFFYKVKWPVSKDFPMRLYDRAAGDQSSLPMTEVKR